MTAVPSRSTDLRPLYVTVLLLITAALIGLAFAPAHHKAATAKSSAQVLYITNKAQQYISDATIRHDIPAWETAVNRDFAGYWHTTQYKLVFLGSKDAPSGSMSAVFLKSGPVQGALAYHWIERGNAPSITVYAGTGAYLGFNNSVSFTHELFELAADPLTSYVSQGYPSSVYYEETAALGIDVVTQEGVLGWFNEVADPVEADAYSINGVQISDFVTPAWFNDGVGSRYDYMGLCQQPFWIRPGGYAQYLTADGWQMVENFRTGHPSDRGFNKLDPAGR